MDNLLSLSKVSLGKLTGYSNGMYRGLLRLCPLTQVWRLHLLIGFVVRSGRLLILTHPLEMRGRHGMRGLLREFEWRFEWFGVDRRI